MTAAPPETMASRRPSPRDENRNTITAMTMHGGKIGNASSRMWVKASRAIVPRLTAGGWAPSPRKLRLASAMIARPIENVTWTRIGATALAKTCRPRIRGVVHPMDRAASTKLSLDTEAATPRVTR